MKCIVILVLLAAAVPAAISHAQQAPEKRSQIEQQQDRRYLVYVSGIT